VSTRIRRERGRRLQRTFTAALFLDRDGTIIKHVDYPRDPELVELMPGAGLVLSELRSLGYLLVLVSNQSGIGRGLITREEAKMVHEEVVRQLAVHNVQLHAALYCPHAPADGCSCRKPSPGLLLQAAREAHVDLSRSIMIGDKLIDVAAGRLAGCRTILLTPDPPVGDLEFSPHHVAADWLEVRALIVAPYPAPLGLEPKDEHVRR